MPGHQEELNNMDKNIELTPEEWEAVYASVYREYKRTYSRVIHDSLKRGKMLSDASAQRWLTLLHKIESRLELLEADSESRN